jgi:hypothetical protein
MRFTIATTALLLANCGASTDERSGNKRIPRIGSEGGAVKKRMLLRGNTQPVNQKGPKQGQLRNPTAKKLFRRLVNKKKGRAMKVENTMSEGNEELALPDLGVIGSRNLQKAGKESIMDKDSIRESSSDRIYNDSSSVSNDEIDDALSDYNSFLLTSLQDVCKKVSDGGDYGYGNVNCDCNNFDFESVNGTIECGFYSVSDSSDLCQSTINYCGEPVELCYRETIVLEASDPENYSYTTCATYTKPYQQHVCLTFEHTAGEKRSYEADTNLTTVVEYGDNEVSYTNSSPFPCSVQFNDMECNSCSTAIRTFQQNFFNEETGESEIVGIVQDRCFQIDCSNTGDKTNIIDTCDRGSFLPTTVGDNVVFGDDCTRCQPCGLGYRVHNLDAEGIFPVIGEYQCSGLELAAKIGFFDRKLCPQVQAATAKYCGCDPIFYDSSLPLFPTQGTSRSDIGLTSSINSNSYEPSIVQPGDTMGDSSCDVCGSQTAIVANPDAIVTLPKGILTSCSALQGLGRLGMFTSDYCRSEVMPLVFRTCGGCYHGQAVTLADPSDILDPSFQDVEDHQPSITEDISTEIPASSSTFVVGEESVSCQICEIGRELALPNNPVTLSVGEIGEISCKAFEEELMKDWASLTESFCLKEASVIADTYCGGCVEAEPKLTTTAAATITTSSMEIVASRIDGENDQKSKPSAGELHNAYPEELDVDSDGQGDDSDDSDAFITNAASTEISSAYSLRSKAWMILAIPCSFLVNLS